MSGRFAPLCFLLALGLPACATAASSLAPSSSSTQPAEVAVLADSTTSTPATLKPTTTGPTTTSRSLEYRSRISPIEGPIAERIIGLSWREGCPLPLDDLRFVEVSYIDFDGAVQDGELVVAASVAEDIVTVFRSLFDARFPIERMHLVSDYGADDMASMLANNTSAFNCRFVEGTQGWSEHAFGQAIDVNPLVNPWVRNDSVSPPEGARFADRTVVHQGGLYEGSAAVAAFTAVGWVWGGTWPGSQDYQHFSSTGR